MTTNTGIIGILKVRMVIMVVMAAIDIRNLTPKIEVTTPPEILDRGITTPNPAITRATIAGTITTAIITVHLNPIAIIAMIGIPPATVAVITPMDNQKIGRADLRMRAIPARNATPIAMA
jgi:hypothetical protein